MAMQTLASQACLGALLGMASAEDSLQVGGACEFVNPPVGKGSYWDPNCLNPDNDEHGGDGCLADGNHTQCRYCGGGEFLSIPCPASSCSFSQHPYIPYYWDSQCEMGMLGCNADGTNIQCRYCGDFPYSAVPCPAEGAMAPPEASCAFETTPSTPTYWEPGCIMGMLGCNADGQNVQCRYCGKGAYSNVHCPGSQVCDFDNIPTTPYFYDPECEYGEVGCRADGVNDECRYCGVGAYESVPCPEPYVGVNICHSTMPEQSLPYFWDESCQENPEQLGCLADQIHPQCRFCGCGEYADIPCPEYVDIPCPTRRLGTMLV